MNSSPLIKYFRQPTPSTILPDLPNDNYLVSICSLCDYQFVVPGPLPRNGGREAERILRVFLADKNERALARELCPSCTDQLEQLLETGRQLSLLLNLVTTLLLQNSRFTLIHPKPTIISKLFSNTTLEDYFARSGSGLDFVDAPDKRSAQSPTSSIADIDREIDELETNFHLDRIKGEQVVPEEHESIDEHENESEPGGLTLCSSFPSLVSLDSCSKDQLGNNIMNVNISALESSGCGSTGFDQTIPPKLKRKPSPKSLGTSITNLIANTTNDELDVCFTNRIEKMKVKKYETKNGPGSSKSGNMFRLPLPPKAPMSPLSISPTSKKQRVARCGKEKTTEHSKKRFTCNLCPKMWETKRDLDVHVGSHLKLSNFICEICGAAYRHKSGLKNHVALHKGEAKYKCVECDKEFTQKSGLERHLEAIHSSARNYECTECNRTFRYHSSFNLHKQSHKETPDKKFRCDIPSCTLSFFTSYHLKRHLKSHTGDKPHECSKCGKGFSEKYNLESHLKTHDK